MIEELSSSSMAKIQETSADVAMDDILPVLAASIASSSDLPELSPEDAAWVDSCLEPNPHVPENEWGPLGEALLETLTARLGNESGQVEPELPTEEGDDIEVEIEDSEENELIQQLKKADIFPQEECDGILEVEEEDEENELIEGMKKAQIADHEEIESHDSIFKIWDLEWPEEDEESELIKQLKKALMGSKTGGEASAAEEKLSVDELVAGIGDLSLEQPSE